jgi:DNA-binding SARP family transcriptional activator
MRFSLLGPLVVVDSAGGRVTVPGPRLRILLAALLLHANMPVPLGELAEMVWDGSPPSGAVASLRSNVRRLRSAVDPGAARIAASAHGYVIQVEPAELDVLEFEVLCRDTRAALRAGRWEFASATAARALELWRADPLLDVPAETLRAEFGPRLERLRLQVLEDRLDAGLRLGHHQELIPQLLDVTARYPLRERFHAQLMLALASTGRRAEALSAYQQARRVLVDELGIEPGPELRDVHRQVLAAAGPEPVRTADHSDEPLAEPPERIARPAQLPADAADFTGRHTQAAYLYDALAGQEAASPGAVRVAVVAGAAGLGKTTLALHVAHQVRDLFPDGQLYAHLAGASGQPTVPAEVLARFLRDLGVDGDKIPASSDERAALYRTRLADRKVLVLLDDAKDAAQLRPLLPGSASCAVLVTSRSRTPSLLSTAFVDLTALPEVEALELFSRIAGDGRPRAEPEATAEILRACAGLPLAIRICAARLATRGRWRITNMAARLRDERRRLDELQIGDLEVRASFQVSYDSLRADRHRLDPAHVFRLLGLWPGQLISVPAAAALTSDAEQEMAGALEALVDASLLESPEPDRYQLHDLLRLFATERARAEETEQMRLGAVAHLLQWYLATATAAADALSPDRYRIPVAEPPAPGAPPNSVQDALAWYDNEHTNVMAAIRQAASADLHDVAWRLPTALFPLFSRRHNWADCVTAHRIAVTSARKCGSRLGEAWALQGLGQGLASFGQTEAFACLEEAMAIRREIGDLAGQAQTAVSIPVTYYKLQGPQAAYDHSLAYLEVLRQAGRPILLAAGLNNYGEFCRLLGRVDEATGYLQQALGIWTAIGGGNGHGHVLENLGLLHLQSGRFDEAVASLTEAHQIQLAQGQLLGQAQALRYLGQAQRGAGQVDQARESLEAAMALFKVLQAAAEVEDVRSGLAALASEAGPSAR